MEPRSTRSSPSAPPVRLLGDVACPWTYLTFVALRRAFGGALVLEWHPFVLDARDLTRHRTRLIEAVNRYARELGAPFRAESLAQPIDSRRAHGAILAAGSGAADVAEALFAARFAAGVSLADRNAIATVLGARLGAATAAALASRLDERLEMVERADRAARAAGVAEVPVAVVDGVYAIAGLQPPEAFIALAELARVERG